MVRQLLERFFTAVAQVVTAVLYPYYLVRERQGWGGRIPILMYHQIGRPPGAARVSQDCVSPERFERQLRALLDSGYRVISLGQLLGLLNGPIEARRRCVALTFDDGLRGQFCHAYPILKRYGVPATFFLVAGYVGMKTVPPHLGLEPGQFGDRAQLAEWCPLSWEEAGELARNRMEIGSHSVSHRSLGCLGRETAINEVRWSKTLLEAQLGVAVEFFAYPFGSHGYGDFDASIQALLGEAGYRGACTTVVGRTDGNADLFALRRIPVNEGDGPFRIRCKVIGAFDWTGPVKEFWQRMMPRKERVDLGLAAATGPGAPL